jgi:hypothetical protein
MSIEGIAERIKADLLADKPKVGESRKRYQAKQKVAASA